MGLGHQGIRPATGNQRQGVAGWKLVEGRSNRKYTNDTVVADVVEHAGFDPYERKVLGVTAMQKLLGNPALTSF
jgi:hypothetical protein